MLARRTLVDHGRDEASGSMAALIEQVTGLARRQYRVFLVVPAVALAIGLLYLLVTPAQYTATTTLLIDSTTLRVLQNQLQPQGDVPLDTLQVGSQVEILASRKLGLAVVKDLHLADDPEFSGTNGWSPFATPTAGSAEEREQRALDEFLAHRSIARADKTYALNISYTSKNAATAAKVANAIAEAYIDDQLGAKYQTVTRAGAWLQDRINELKSKAAAADRAVLDFKEKNNIVDLGGAGASSTAGASTFSRLIGEQQLYELNSQLATARGATSEAKARLDRIEQVQKLDVSEGAVADTLKNDVITRLRNQYIDLSAREANISGRYGADHAAAANLRDQMEEVRRNIRSELGRIAGSYRSDYEIARTRQESMERSLAALVSEGQLTNRDRLGLAELESSAKVYHTLFDNFLQRYMEAIQQQSFPITDARIISPAVAPTKKSKPVTSLVLAISLSLGLMAGIGIAALREAVDGVFRTARQVEQELGARCLSVIPLASASASPVLPRSGAVMAADPGDLPALPAPEGATGPAPAEQQRYAFSDSLKRRAVDDPISVFTEAFRAIKVSAWLQANVRETKVIGITSTLPSEGKSTVAANLAALMADAGRRVVLIDADLRNPTLARSLTPRPQVGWLEVMSGKLDLAEATGREPTTGLALLPLLLTEAPVHSDEVLASQGFRDLLERLRQSYDYIIVDLPPLAPVVDVRAIVPAIDSFVFVVEWGATSVKTVRRHLLAETELHDRLLGIVLNKANLRMLERFDQPGIYQNGYYMRGG
ncbi:polysaccharide biosynthesis tyrosine autokinase [Bradyrhizobium betae]|nr:polysaccharide biosynthesis tyrosine autokinase [Bradyrhizobium betae]MCS3730586.1 succinoglycan biosynthesis transport protein ExoP [Bradyrhizobium betae]